MLNGLLLKSPPCLVFTPSFCKAAWGTSRPRDPRCVELVTLRAGLCLTLLLSILWVQDLKDTRSYFCPFFG